MKTVATVAELVAQVKADGHDSVYLFACHYGLGVSYDSFDTDVVASVNPIPEVLEKAQVALQEQGNSVYTDFEQWRSQLNEWHAMGGGDGEAW